MTQDYIPKDLRERVAVQAHHRCGYCLTTETIVGTPMEIDHILPQSLVVPTVNTPAFVVLLYAKGTISYAAARKKLQQLENLGTISLKILEDARRVIDRLHP